MSVLLNIVYNYRVGVPLRRGEKISSAGSYNLHWCETKVNYQLCLECTNSFYIECSLRCFVWKHLGTCNHVGFFFFFLQKKLLMFRSPIEVAFLLSDFMSYCLLLCSSFVFFHRLCFVLFFLLLGFCKFSTLLLWCHVLRFYPFLNKLLRTVKRSTARSKTFTGFT